MPRWSLTYTFTITIQFSHSDSVYFAPETRSNINIDQNLSTDNLCKRPFELSSEETDDFKSLCD